MSSTSTAAVTSLGETVEQLRSRVLVEIRARGVVGATCDEVEIALGFRHQTASARIRELAIDRRITDSGERRLTRSGRKAIAWVESLPLVASALQSSLKIGLARSIDEVEAAGGYKIVYADPPWQYKNAGRGSTENHYHTTALQRIAQLPIRRIAARDSVLFLWVTWPFLRDCFTVIDGWGFTFKTCAFVWVKYHEESGKRCVGGGFWTRANTEFCLLCVRGTDHPKRVDKSVRQLIEKEPEELFGLPDAALIAPRQEHSAKPPEARERIRKLMGDDLTAIELFARCVGDDGLVVPRGRVAVGWDQWGNECDSDVYMGDVRQEVLSLW